MTTHTIACYFDGGTFHTSFNIPNADAVMNNQCRGTRTSGIYWAYQIRLEDSKIIYAEDRGFMTVQQIATKWIGKFSGTNNEAEYIAFWNLLEKLQNDSYLKRLSRIRNPPIPLCLYGDSNLVLNQVFRKGGDTVLTIDNVPIKPNWKCKSDNLIPINRDCISKARELSKEYIIVAQHTPREHVYQSSVDKFGRDLVK